MRYVADTFQRNQREAEDRLRRAIQLRDAWQRQAARVRPAVESQKAAVTNRFVGYLPFLAAGMVAVGAGTILALLLFEPRPQMELIKSGQVLQFVTVMNLLIVILSLGVLRLMTENTLGTLLGGVAGYVLSEGVGKSVGYLTTTAALAHPGRSRDDATRRNVIPAIAPAGPEGTPPLTSMPSEQSP